MADLDFKGRNQQREEIYANSMLQEKQFSMDEERAKMLKILEYDRTVREKRKMDIEQRIKSSDKKQRHVR